MPHRRGTDQVLRLGSRGQEDGAITKLEGVEMQYHRALAGRTVTLVHVMGAAPAV